MYKPQHLGNSTCVICDDWEFYLHVQVLLYPFHPFYVAEHLVYAQSDKLAVKLFKLVKTSLKSHELCRAHRSKIRGMTEQDKPFALVLFWQFLPSMSRLYFHIREFFPNQGHTSFFFHISSSSYSISILFCHRPWMLQYASAPKALNSVTGT